MKSLIILLIIVTLLTGCWTTPPEPNEIVYRALLIGIGDFMYVNDLKSPPYNVDKMREIFENCKFGESEIEFLVIDELKDLDATKEAVLNGIASTFANADEDDISYLYWCGHGSVKNGQPIICPTDYNSTLQSSITVDELEEALNVIPGTKVVILEACHSGNFIEKGRDFNNQVIEIFSTLGINKDTYQVITSCRGVQVCWEHGTYTYFTLALYLGLQNLAADINENGIVDLTEIHNYVVEWIEENCPKDQDSQIYPEGSIFPIVEY